MKRRLVVIAIALAPIAAAARTDGRQPPADRGDNVVLVTLDGARTQEVFGGLDLDVLESTLADGQTVDHNAAYRKYWAPSPEERRRKLMPFFWTLVSGQGSVAGNQRSGSVVRVQNGHRFSYPGYAEILLGEPHDEAIKSNDPIRNPYPTVLEMLRAELGLPASRVATFASWNVFREIAAHGDGTTFINAGIEPLNEATRDVALINVLQREATTPWEGTRFDAYTFRLAMAYLASARPRVMYIAFDETDDWAHDGRYDHVLDAYSRTDGYLKALWTWLQDQPEYRGRTHLLITTDHGRGRTPKDWRNHGSTVDGSQDVWMAFASPRMPERGEWHDASPLSTSQIAATLAGWMGVDWNVEHPHAGTPIH